MGKKKATKKKPVKKREKALPVPRSFKCPFCGHDDAVECLINKDTFVGRLSCRVCSASFQQTCNYLTEPIDVYSAWIDECEEANVGELLDEEEN